MISRIQLTSTTKIGSHVYTYLPIKSHIPVFFCLTFHPNPFAQKYTAKAQPPGPHLRHFVACRPWRGSQSWPRHLNSAILPWQTAGFLKEDDLQIVDFPYLCSNVLETLYNIPFGCWTLIRTPFFGHCMEMLANTFSKNDRKTVFPCMEHSRDELILNLLDPSVNERLATRM